MTQCSASRSIVKFLHHSGLLPGEYISIDELTDIMVEDGMSLDELQAGLVAAMWNVWVQSYDHYVGLTEEGFKQYEPANDNKGIRILV